MESTIEKKEEVKKKTTAVKSTEMAKGAYELTKKMYDRGLNAILEGKPVAWVMVMCLAEEILQTMEVTSIYTENYATVCAAKRAADPFLEKAEAEGFSNLICGYARTGIGYAIRRKELGGIPPEAPVGGMAEPTVLIGGSTACDPRYKWYQLLRRYMDTPYYSIDIPWPPRDSNLEEVKDYYVEYLVEGLRGMVAFLEKHLGKKMDWDSLSEYVSVGEQTRRKWWECHELRKAVPGPMPAQDMLSCIIPGLFMPGEQEALDFYTKLYNELKYRVENKIGVIPNEKYRLLWCGGLPPWHNMVLFNSFEDHGAVCVMETAYYPGGPPDIPPNITDPLERLAWRMFFQVTERFEKAARGTGHPETERALEFIEDYKIDGLVMHGSVSCRATTIGQIHNKNMIQEHVKIPTLFIESDIVDSRDFSESQTKAKVEAFVETVASSKEGGRS